MTYNTSGKVDNIPTAVVIDKSVTNHESVFSNPTYQDNQQPAKTADADNISETEFSEN